MDWLFYEVDGYICALSFVALIFTLIAKDYFTQK
jgi:hypothetical protein